MMDTKMTKTSSKRLFLDLETYSSADITNGAFKYVESPDFEILLCAYAYDDEPVTVSRTIEPIRAALLDPNVVKVAHNCAFERACFAQVFSRTMPPEQWEDTMAMAAWNGLPLSLDAVGAALHLPDQKLKEGRLLINYFCKPCRPTISNGQRTRNLPEHAPDRWERFCDYNRRDVEVEREIWRRLRGYQITSEERAIEETDAQINDRGILVDTDLAQAAVDLDTACRAAALRELQMLTGLINPNSVTQLKEWLRENGVEVGSLSKRSVADLLSGELRANVRRVLELRTLLGKTSVKKYEAMLAAACSDGRVRGTMQYYGAGRTGRWAGRIVQPQNLPQNHLNALDGARTLVRKRDLDTLQLCYDSVPDVLSQLIRTALIAPAGKTLLVADYSAIEARVIAYLAGEKWRMDVFAGDGKIYEASYAKAFNVPVESVKKGTPERQKGKIMELALGYGGGVNALKAFGADKLGLSDPELQELVTSWRQASPRIPKLWRDVEAAARNALEHPGATYRAASSDRVVCAYQRDRDALRCTLPSGRVLSYWAPGLEDGVTFMAQNQTTRKWERTETWGGRLVENIVQAFARDCLAYALVRLDRAGYKVVMHVHDEIIAEAPKNAHWEDMAAIMCKPLKWAPGLLLKADGYSTPYYKKD